jgi:CRISPR-associated protein Cmr5
MMAQTLEQRRAKHALDQVKPLQEEKIAGNYLSYVKALPAAILINGLGQALATERAASDPAHHRLAQHVSEWLLSPEAHSRYNASIPDDAKLDTAQRLLGRIVAGDQDAYLWAQAEAIAYVTWLKKLANAFIKERGKE